MPYMKIMNNTCPSCLNDHSQIVKLKITCMHSDQRLTCITLGVNSNNHRVVYRANEPRRRSDESLQIGILHYFDKLFHRSQLLHLQMPFHIILNLVMSNFYTRLDTIVGVSFLTIQIETRTLQSYQR